MYVLWDTSQDRCEIAFFIHSKTVEHFLNASQCLSTRDTEFKIDKVSDILVSTLGSHISICKVYKSISLSIYKSIILKYAWASLVAQWQRICLPMQETQVRYLRSS